MRADRSRRQPVDQRAGVAVMQTDIGELAVVDGRERLGDGVAVAVAADEAAARGCLRLRDQMLGAAEADFEADVVDIRVKRTQIGRRGLGEIKRESRQKRLEQRRLPRPQRMALAPPEEGALGFVVSSASFADYQRPQMAGTRPATMRKAGSPPSRQIAGLRAGHFTALRIAAARSVFSQEKPPSLSGARPKWP